MSDNDRPNILFLMTDEHRADVTGYEGNDVVRTPTLDWLASTGVVFSNAYTPSPICIPCRQSLACGQLPRTSGVERFGQDLPPFSMTFARRFSQYAYGSVCAGKLHHTGPEQMQGWTRRIGSNTSVADYHIDGLIAEEVARYPKLGGPKWSDAKEIQRAGVGAGSNTHKPDKLAVDETLAFIEGRWCDAYYDRPGGGRPTLLKVSFNRPHYPYFTDEERFTYYLNRVPLFRETEAFDHPFLGQRQVVPGRDVTERELRRATAAYYGMIDEIDRDFGGIIEYLDHVGQNIDDWIIVYTADHGEMLGQHGIWEKQKFFEASARVPLIIRPRKADRDRWQCEGRVVTQNVNLCDLFATLCDLADIPLPDDDQTVNGAGLDSRSLVPLMRGDVDDWHTRYHNETISQFGGTNLLIKRDALKYQRYDRDDCADAPEVLFDLDADPGESRNLIREPAYADVLNTFRGRAAELGFGPDADPHYRNAGYR